jgi:hypothetical protein
MRGPCLAFMLAVAVLLLIPTHATLAQSPSPMTDYAPSPEECRERCRYLLDPNNPVRRRWRATDPQQAYARCVRNCNKAVGRNFEREADEE